MLNHFGQKETLLIPLFMKSWNKILLQNRLSARQATRYYARSYTARKRAGCKNGKTKNIKSPQDIMRDAEVIDVFLENEKGLPLKIRGLY